MTWGARVTLFSAALLWGGLIVVLSAMSGVTNKMQEYIDEIESNQIIENEM